jgi:transposase
MDVTPELREAVAEWVGEGFSLSEIQRLLSEKFGHTLTYMDVRFLVDDLGLSLQDPETDQASEQDSALSSLGRATEPSSGEDAELEYSGAQVNSKRK